MRLLTLFTLERPQWSVSDLARAAGLHKSVVTRSMATMASAGFVTQDPHTKTYGIGPKAFSVGNTYQPHTILSQIARPIMRDLTDRHRYATSLGVPAGDRFLYLLVNEGNLRIRVAAGVGEVRDYHANAAGKALLTGFSDAEIRRLLGSGSLPALTPYTLTSVDVLLAEVAEVRRTGVAYNRQEANLGVAAVGSPVFDGSGACIAGLSIVYPSHMVTETEVAGFEVAVTTAARLISTKLAR